MQSSPLYSGTQAQARRSVKLHEASLKKAQQEFTQSLVGNARHVAEAEIRKLRLEKDSAHSQITALTCERDTNKSLFDERIDGLLQSNEKLELSLNTCQKEVGDQKFQIEHLESVQSEAWLTQAGTEQLLKDEKSCKDGLIIKLQQATNKLTDQESRFKAELSKFNDALYSKKAALTATEKKLGEKDVFLEQVKGNLNETEKKLEEREVALEQVKSNLTATKKTLEEREVVLGQVKSNLNSTQNALADLENDFEYLSSEIKENIRMIWKRTSRFSVTLSKGDIEDLDQCSIMSTVLNELLTGFSEQSKELESLRKGLAQSSANVVNLTNALAQTASQSALRNRLISKTQTTSTRQVMLEAYYQNTSTRQTF